MATFWDKIKFAKKPFKESKAKAEALAVESKVKKTEKNNDRRPATQYAHVLVRPHLSEKAVALADRSTYVFEVRPDISAPEVANAVNAIYGVMPTRVRMMNVRPRAVRFGRTHGQTRAWKKALVTLPTGKKLDIYG